MKTLQSEHFSIHSIHSFTKKTRIGNTSIQIQSIRHYSHSSYQSIHCPQTIQLQTPFNSLYHYNPSLLSFTPFLKLTTPILTLYNSLNPSNTNSRTHTNSLSQTSYRFTDTSLIPMLRLAYNEPQFNSTERNSDNPLTTKEPILPNDSLPTSIHSTLLHFSTHNSLFNELPHSHLQSQSSPLTTNFFTLTSLTLITSTLFTFRTILG